jgi:hypothetical protein
VKKSFWRSKWRWWCSWVARILVWWTESEYTTEHFSPYLGMANREWVHNRTFQPISWNANREWVHNRTCFVIPLCYAARQAAYSVRHTTTYYAVNFAQPRKVILKSSKPPNADRGRNAGWLSKMHKLLKIIGQDILRHFCIQSNIPVKPTYGQWLRE